MIEMISSLIARIDNVATFTEDPPPIQLQKTLLIFEARSVLDVKRVGRIEAYLLKGKTPEATSPIRLSSE